MAPSKTFARLAAAGALLTIGSLTVAGCGQAGSSGSNGGGATVSATTAGCAPVAGKQLVVLTDDKHLQNADNIIPAVYGKAATSALLANLNKVSAALDTAKLVSLNKSADIDRQTPQAVASAFVKSANLTSGVTKGTGTVVVGAANFTENQIVANAYVDVLKAAGFKASTKTVGNRELYLPALEKGQLTVVPEYTSTLTEFLNTSINGKNAATMASPDLSKTVTALTALGAKKGLKFGTASQAADQNAFAVTTAFQSKYGVKTLSEFSSKCSGNATILGGPPECAQRPFCGPGLQKTYNIAYGKFVSLDAGGPASKQGLMTGKVTIALVFSSDGSLTASSS